MVQPDLNYNGGLTRAHRVARMARKRNMWICPHNTQTGAASVNILQLQQLLQSGPFMRIGSAETTKTGIVVFAKFRYQERRDTRSQRPRPEIRV